MLQSIQVLFGVLRFGLEQLAEYFVFWQAEQLRVQEQLGQVGMDQTHHLGVVLVVLLLLAVKGREQ